MAPGFCRWQTPQHPLITLPSLDLLQLIRNSSRGRWPVALIHLSHLFDEEGDFGKDRITVGLDRSKQKGRIGRIISRQQLVEDHTKAVDVGARGGLHFAILLRGSIAWRAKRHGIFDLAGLEMTSDAEINQVEVPFWCAHDISRFEVPKDDGRLARVQVIQHGAKLETGIENLFNRKMLLACVRIAHGFLQVDLQSLAFNVIHYEIPAPGVAKVVVDARQVRMAQMGEHQGFAFETRGSCCNLLLTETFLLHCFDSDEAIAKTGVRRLIDGAKTSLAYQFKDTITIIEQHLFAP